MRFASGDVRDHIVSSKIDQGPPWWPLKATQRRRSPKINFRETFRVARFSTFATISPDEQTSLSASMRSEKKRTSSGPVRHVSKVPLPDSCTAANTPLFDDLVARARSVGGASRPTAFAVLRLITNSNLVGYPDRLRDRPASH